MKGIAFDPQKDVLNLAKHGISLSRASELRIVVIILDKRFNYGEQRFKAFGYIDGLAYCLSFALRDEAKRAISLRRAHLKELERYAEDKKDFN